MWTLAADTTTTNAAPWWFAGTIGVVSLLAGLLIKWVIDLVSTRNRDRREDKLRFIQDKRVAYAQLLEACYEVADAEHVHRLLLAKGRRLDQAADDASDDDVADYNEDRLRVEDRRIPAYQAVSRAAAVVELIAPEDVVSSADVLVSRCHHPHLLPSRVEAERAYVEAVRKELGYASTGHLPYIVYEDYIEFDDPASGIPSAEWSPGADEGEIEPT